MIYCRNHECPLRNDCKRVYIAKPNNDGLLNTIFALYQPKDGMCEFQIKK